MSHQAIKVFLAYSHTDDQLRDKLAAHLTTLQKQKIIDSWDDSRIEPGTNRLTNIEERLNSADIILLLVSANFLNDCWDREIRRAMERHHAGEAHVIPVILRDCFWQESPFGKLAPLPSNGTAVTRWDDQDAAFTEIVAGIQRIANRAQVSTQASESKTRSRPVAQVLTQLALRKLARYGAMVALPVIVIRFLGFLEPFELAAYDHMMRLRLDAEPDPRLLLVEIDEDDRANWADNSQRLVKGDSSLPETAIEQLLDTLQTQYSPKAIGLDIYRPKATDPNFLSLKNRLATDENLFVICKVTDPGQPDAPDYAPPPEIDIFARQGFSDFVSDDARDMIRRQLFHIPAVVMPDNSPCKTPFSLSFRLATYFLEATASPTTTQIQINGVTLLPLSPFSGGYQGTIYADEQQILLDYRAPNGNPNEIARRIKLTDILENRISAEELATLQNRIVLVGVVDETKRDLWRTPVSDRKVPGLTIHAQMVSHLLRVLTGEQRLIWVWHWTVEWMWIGLWGIFGAAVGWHLERLRRIFIVSAIAIGSLLALCIIIFYTLQGWLPLLPAEFSLIMAIMLARIRKRQHPSKI